MAILQLVIFDCDGVLVDSETLTNKLFLHQLAKDGLDLPLNEFMNEFVGYTMAEASTKMHEKYQHQLTAEFFDNFHASSLKALAADLEPIQGIHEAINALNVPYCLASNSAPDKIQVMLKKTNLTDQFKNKIFSADLVKNPKPAPDIYLLAAATNHVAVENCLVVEDSFVGVSAAVAAGITVFGYATSTDPQILMDAGAKITFKNMEDLALLIAQHFEEEATPQALEAIAGGNKNQHA